MTITNEFCKEGYRTVVSIDSYVDGLDLEVFKKYFYNKVLKKTLLKCKDNSYALKVKSYTLNGVCGTIDFLEMTLCKNINKYYYLKWIILVNNLAKEGIKELAD